MLKKSIALFVGLMFVFSGVVGAFATEVADDQNPIQIICSGDVEKINIQLIPAEPYSGTMGIYVIKADVTVEDITPDNVSEAVIAIKEIKPTDGEYSATLNLRDGIEAGWYRIVATDYLYGAPEWNDTDIEARSAEIYLADANSVNDAISAVNGATKNTINSIIEGEYGVVLNIELPVDYEALDEKIAKYFILERKNTYSNTFETIEEIQKAYEVAVLCARMATVEKDALKELVESKKEELLSGITEDYDAFADEVVRVFAKIRDDEEYKGDDKAPVEVMKDLLRRATAVAALNESSRADIPQIIEKYNDVFELDLGGKFLKVDKTEVYKALSRMAFDSVEDVQNAFDARIEELLNKKQTTGGGGGGGGSSFGGGSASGKVEYEFTDNEKTVVVENKVFADMAQAEWANEYVEYLVERKIVNGDGTGNFRPNARVTREEFVKMIVLAFDLYDEDATADFADADKNAWYYPYIASAVKSGIIRGVDEKNFGIGRNITRQDIAVIANRIYGMNGKTVEAAEDAERFADYDEIADYAKESVAAMRDAGIINGFEDNTFMPADFATRAQSAKIIYVLTQEVIGL